MSWSSTDLSFLLLPVFLCSYFANILALSPVASSGTLVEGNVVESCDSPCYINRNPSSLSSPQNITFLCGSDGFTYLNFEELTCVQKRCGTEIKLKQYGRCPRITTSETPKLTFPLEPQQHKTSNPYSRLNKNFLRLLSQSPSFQDPSQPLLFPEDSRNQLNVIEPRPLNYWQPRPSSRGFKKICLPAECNCPENLFRPVCGSDMVTYGNKCLLECSKECKPDLVKLYDGYCGKARPGASCILNRCNCPEEEYDDEGLQLRHPVCGSDGVTYGSLCLLECNRNCKPELLFRYNGYCGGARLAYSQDFQ